MALNNTKNKLIFLFFFVFILIFTDCLTVLNKPATAHTLVNSQDLNHSITIAKNYLSNACNENGRFNYILNLNPDVTINKNRYNILRHAGTLYALCEYRRIYADPSVDGAIEKSAHYLKLNAIDPVPGQNEMLAVWSYPKINGTNKPIQAKLGGTGLGLLALMSLERIKPGSTPLETLRKLASFIIFMQKKDGSFYSKFIPSEGGRSDKWTSLYYPGEAAMGLLSLYEKDPSSKWLQGACDAIGYLARSRAGKSGVPEDHWALLATDLLIPNYQKCRKPPIPVLSLHNHAAQICESILRTADSVGRDPAISGPLTPYGMPCSTATRIEGLLAALRFLPADKVRLRTRINKTVQNGIAFLIREQIVSGTYTGAFTRIMKNRKTDTKNTDRWIQRSTEIRIDYVQHALCAMIMYDQETFKKNRIEKRQLNRNILDHSLKLGKTFLINHQKKDGNFTYEYDFVHQRFSSDDSQVRQAGVLWALALIHQDRPQPDTEHAINKGIEFFKRYSKTHINGDQFIEYPGMTEGRTGTMALVTLTLIDYLRTIEANEENQAVKLYFDECLHFLLSLRLDNGQFHSSYRFGSGEGFGTASPYFDGEILLALVKAAKYMGREDLKEIIMESAEAMYNNHVIVALQMNPDSPVTKGFYQWATMAFYEIYTSGWAGSEKYAERIINLADWMIDVHKTLDRRKNTAYAQEGIVTAYEVARITGHKNAQKKMAGIVDKVLARLISWQVGGPIQNTFLKRNPTNDPAAIGGVMNSSKNPALRLDVTQHQMHAIILARRYIYQD